MQRSNWFCRSLVIIAILVSGLMTAGASAAARAESGVQIRVLDLNICGAVCNDGETTYTAEYIKAKALNFNAQIITLQEVCSNQYKAILKALGPGWYGVFKKGTYASVCGGSLKHGIAIFTRGVHTDARWWLLPHNDPATNRSWWLLCVTWKNFNVCTTHIRAFTAAHPPKPGEVPYLIKRAQTWYARDIILGFDGPTIWAGDFNQQPDSIAMQKIYDTPGWVEADHADNETTVDGNDKKIDFVWGSEYPTTVWANTKGSIITDHRILYATLNY